MVTLSKSRIKLYWDCPYQYKLKYVDKLQIPEEEISPALTRGIAIHDALEKYVKGQEDSIPQDYMKYAEKFKRWLDKTSESFSSVSVLHSELKIHDPVIDCIGIIDAVIKADDTLLLLDYKTGKDRGLKHHLFELALYHLLLETIGVKCTHWGIFFIDAEKTYTCQVLDSALSFAKNKIEVTRNLILDECFEKKPTIPCNWCQFYKKGCEGTGKYEVVNK